MATAAEMCRAMRAPQRSPVVLDGGRQVLAQDAWLCHLCGDLLEESALVVLRETKVLSDTALHSRCLALAVAVCPHLAAPGGSYTAAAVTRADLLADGRPLPPRRTDAAEDEGHLWTPAWTVRDNGALLDPVALTGLCHTAMP